MVLVLIDQKSFSNLRNELKLSEEQSIGTRPELARLTVSGLVHVMSERQYKADSHFSPGFERIQMSSLPTPMH